MDHSSARWREYACGCCRKKKSITPDAGNIFTQASLNAQAPLDFLPPELMTSALDEVGDGADDQQVDQLGAWDVAIRFHEIKTLGRLQSLIPKLRRISVRAILDQARAAMGATVRPVRSVVAPLREIPLGAERIEESIEETLEHNPEWMSGREVSPEFWVEAQISRDCPVILCLDTSLSMTGEKLALLAVAMAIVLLQFENDPIGIIAFENEAQVLKHPMERVGIETILERLMDLPCQGYTHLERGLTEALTELRSLPATHRGRAHVLLLTDGKYTAGRDPIFLAPQFDSLTVLKLGRDRAGLALCRDLARIGRGGLYEVSEQRFLPEVMVSVVKNLLRGKH